MKPMTRRCPLRVRRVAARCMTPTSSRSIRKICRSSVPSPVSFVSTWARVRRAAAVCRAGIRCRPPTPWAPPPCRSAPEAAALVVVLHKGFGLPLAHVVTLLRDRFGLRVTRGALVHVCARAAARATPTYDALCAQVRGSPVVSPDETGWKVAGTLHWLWAFATPETTVYAIRPGRGFGDAVTILGADFAGVLARDGWAPYRRFGHAVHQTCLAHLLRRCRLLQVDHPRSPFAGRVQQRLQQALALRDRYAAGAVSAHGFASARGRLLEQTLDLLTTVRSRLPAVQRFAAHLTVEASALFTFLGDPAIDATNWRAEHAIRPAVAMRKVCGGNRSAPRRAHPTGSRVRAPHHSSTRARSHQHPRHALAGPDPHRAAPPASTAAVESPVKQRRTANTQE